MLQVPFELTLEQLRLMPGRNGLATLFKVLQQAEAAMVNDEVGPVGDGAKVLVCMLTSLTKDEVMANLVQLDCQVVIPLPMEDQ